MRKRWILYLVLSLLIGRAWGLHLPSVMGQAMPCHTEAVHGLHAASAPAQAMPASDDASGPAPVPGEGVAAASDLSSDVVTSSASTPTDAAQGDGHVCCLVVLGTHEGLWPAGPMPTPDRPEPHWASASRSLDLRPPIQGL